MNKEQQIQNLREDYRANTLEISDVEKNPIQQFKHWFQEALDSNIKEPNAMTLATATPTSIPSARIVLLKGIDEKGFIFYTNYYSRKGLELTINPKAALVFWWMDLQRQVRIEGKVEKVEPEISMQYFQSRPRGSQIGAHSSPQSQVIPNRASLEQRVKGIESHFSDTEKLPLPEHWGGYRVKPHLIEFWQGRSSRLHDRLRYTLEEGGVWKVDRLAP